MYSKNVYDCSTTSVSILRLRHFKMRHRLLKCIDFVLLHVSSLLIIEERLRETLHATLPSIDPLCILSSDLH